MAVPGAVSVGSYCGRMLGSTRSTCDDHGGPRGRWSTQMDRFDGTLTCGLPEFSNGYPGLETGRELTSY